MGSNGAKERIMFLRDKTAKEAKVKAQSILHEIYIEKERKRESQHDLNYKYFLTLWFRSLCFTCFTWQWHARTLSKYLCDYDVWDTEYVIDKDWIIQHHWTK